MKIRRFLVFFLFLYLSLQAFGKTTGYLSFDYSKGQEHSNTARGTFHNVRLGLMFSSDETNAFNYLAEVSSYDEFDIEIEQAWLGLKSSDAFHLKLGLFLVPFGRYNQSNRAHQTVLIYTPLNVDNIFPRRWKDLGVLLEGRLRSFFYSAYIGNGLFENMNLKSGQQYKDNNKNKGKGVRLGLSLGQGIDVAYSQYEGKYDEMNERSINIRGVDMAWTSKSIQIFSEYNEAHTENPPGFENGKADGYFIQVSFDMGSFFPVFSYQKLNYTDEFHGEGFTGPLGVGKGIAIDRKRWTVGCVYFPSQNILFKLEYDWNRDTANEKKDNVFSMQAAVSF